MKLYVIRHGETEQGKNKIIANVKEPLNATGINQAIKVGKDIQKLDIDVVYCSPMERTKHTLKLFNLDKDIPVIIDNRIIERNMGKYENMPFEDFNWDILWDYNSDLKYTECESMKSVYKRVSEFINDIKSNNDKNVLLVTHGGISRAIYWFFNGVDKSLFECENCKIYKYEF